MRRSDGSNECSWKMLLIGAVALAISGCSMFFPGADTRTAAEQKKITTYDSEKNLAIDESTTQNNRTVMVESESEGGAKITFNEDGSPKEITNATTVLTQCSEPRDVMQQLIRRDEQNARVAERMMGTVEAALSLIGLRMQVKSAEAIANPSGNRTVMDDFKDYIREAVREQMALATRPAPSR